MKFLLSNLDALFLIIILASIIFAIIKGGIAVIFSTINWIVTLLFLKPLCNYITPYLHPVINNNTVFKYVVVFILGFITITLLLSLIKIIAMKIIYQFELTDFNFGLAIIAGFLRGLIICASMIVLFNIFNFSYLQNWQKSKLNSLLAPTVEIINHAILTS